MSAVIPCTPCCPTTQTVNVPGAQGFNGADGTNGSNAFTATSAQFTVTDGTAQTIQVLSSAWIAVGELLFISDGTHKGTFQVTAVPTTTSVTVAFLSYPLDTAVPFTMALAAVVTPTGQKFTPGTPKNLVGTGTVAVTSATTQLNVASNPPTWTIPDTHTYIIFSRAKFDSTGLTYAGTTALTLKLRRTNNTPADLLSIVWTFPAAPVQNQSILALTLPPLFYTPAQVNDVIELWGATAADPTAGALNCKETYLGGFQLF